MLHLALKITTNLTFSSPFSRHVYVIFGCSKFIECPLLMFHKFSTSIYIYIYIYQTALDTHVMPNCHKNSMYMNVNIVSKWLMIRRQRVDSIAPQIQIRFYGC